jgi:hypothetical protein
MSRTGAGVLATIAVAASALAGPAAGPAAAGRAPALATGTSDATGTLDGSISRWRLSGRRLTVRLSRALHPLAGNRVVTARAECGEDTIKPGTYDAIQPWATVTRGSARVKASTHTVRVVLARDLAARTNFCELSVAATLGIGSSQARAVMKVRRGAQRGCTPGPRERVVYANDTIRVTTAHAEDASASTSVDGYRACRLPDGNLRRIERAGDSGGAGGSGTTATRFVGSATWLTWVSTYTPHSELGGVQAATVRQVDLRSGRVQSVDGAPGTISALAVGPTGVAAWLRQRPAPGTPLLEAHAPGGSLTFLDRVLPIVCIRAPCEGAGPITDVAVRDRTVTWRNAGVARSATLP